MPGDPLVVFPEALSNTIRTLIISPAGRQRECAVSSHCSRYPRLNTVRFRPSIA